MPALSSHLAAIWSSRTEPLIEFIPLTGAPAGLFISGLSSLSCSVVMCNAGRAAVRWRRCEYVPNINITSAAAAICHSDLNKRRERWRIVVYGEISEWHVSLDEEWCKQWAPVCTWDERLGWTGGHAEFTVTVVFKLDHNRESSMQIIQTNPPSQGGRCLSHHFRCPFTHRGIRSLNKSVMQMLDW